MNATELTNVCRTCPSVGGGEELLNIFDERLSVTYNLKEVILVTTGVEISKDDLISKKICRKCCNITLKMFQFRQDALKQDRALKEMLTDYLGNKGIKLPNTCITIKKKEKTNSCPLFKVPRIEQSGPSITKQNLKNKLHSSVAELYKKYPDLKLPSRCFNRDISPIVSLTMGDVECYFTRRKLNMRKFISRTPVNQQNFNAVAKKKTSTPIMLKTVAPLKISLKGLENNQKPDGNDNNDVSTIMPKKRGRKRKIPLIDNDQGPKAKVLDKNIEFVLDSTTVSVTNTSEPEMTVLTKINSSLATADSSVLTTPQPIISETIPKILEEEEKSSEISANISETTLTNSSSKPEFIESLGLTPRIVTTKSHKLLVCNVCGSVHNNGIELKWHTRKHMVCQFCKRKFKSIEAKQNHVDKFCKTKKIMNSPGPLVALEKVHLNLDIRRKYTDAFSSFNPIPGLLEPAPLEHVILEAASPPPDIAADGVIVLSDDEESLDASSDPLSGILTPLADMPSPALGKGVYNCVSQIRPDLRIKNNTVINRLAANMSDNELIKDLIKLIRSEQHATCEQIIQTDLPSSRDIKINNFEETCQFNKLKEELMIYKIPVKVSNGAFKAFYQLGGDVAHNKSMALWDNLPAIDHYKGTTLQTTNTSSDTKSEGHQEESKAICPNLPPINIIVPTELTTVVNSQVNSTCITSCSVPVSMHTTTANASTLSACFTTTTVSTSHLQRDSMGLANAQVTSINSVVSNGVAQPKDNQILNHSSSITIDVPPIQKYTLSRTPPLLINKSIDNPKTYSKVADTKIESASQKHSIENNSKSRSPALIDNGSGHLSYSNIPNINTSVVGSCIIVRPDPSDSKLQPSTNTSLLNGSLSTTNASVIVPPPTTNLSTSASTNPSTTEPVKFRVKKVWELQ